MANIQCPACGQSYAEEADCCPTCGLPNTQTQNTPAAGKAPLSVARLVAGILSIVFSLFILLQSCAAGISNALEENGATSGTSGFMLAICMLAAGIVGIATRKSHSKGGPIAAVILYWFGAILTIGTGSTYGDLPIWGGLAALFGLLFLISAIKTKK